jgi:hypothetical protein
MNNMMKLAAVAMLALIPALAPVAYAGKGGSAALVEAAINSRSTDAIIAEVERTENLICADCVQLITNLTEDSRFSVREVAAWWFAKRPVLKDMLASQFSAELAHGSAVQVRNAADFLGFTKTYSALPLLTSAMSRGELGAEAKLALVRAVGYMAHIDGNAALTTAMSDSAASVRAAAVTAWRDVLGQKTAQPVVARLGDSDAKVRAQAATVVGGLLEQSARPALEALVVSDGDSVVRRNAAWALGQLGNAGSRAALTLASGDSSALVRGVAKASLAQLN